MKCARVWGRFIIHSVSLIFCLIVSNKSLKGKVPRNGRNKSIFKTLLHLFVCPIGNANLVHKLIMFLLNGRQGKDGKNFDIWNELRVDKRCRNCNKEGQSKDKDWKKKVKLKMNCEGEHEKEGININFNFKNYPTQLLK